MQVDLSVVLSAGSAVLSVLFGVIFTLAKYAHGNREREVERRIGRFEADFVSLETKISNHLVAIRNELDSGDEEAMDRLRMLEINEAKLAGELALLREKGDVLKDRISNVEKLVGSRATSYQHFPATRAPSTPIPPKEK